MSQVAVICATLILIRSHYRVTTPAPIPVPEIHLFPFPWECHVKHGNPALHSRCRPLIATRYFYCATVSDCKSQMTFSRISHVLRSYFCDVPFR